MVVVTVVVMGWLASSASAAFPGVNGLLAVQPAAGGGIVLVTPSGRGERRVCVGGSRCGSPRRPRWSPDGRALVFAGPGIRIIYPDGSCLNCHFGAAPNPAFKPGGTVISFIRAGRVTLDKIDGVRQRAPASGLVSDAVWSAAGRLAVAHRGMIWVGRPGRLRRVGLGSDPSWSPDGTLVAAVQRGWVVIIRVRDHRVRRLVPGTAPAFSPDGRWLAYVAPNHRLTIVRASGVSPAPRPVGNVQALSVDWQPKPGGSHAACTPPAGSTVLAQSAGAVVTLDGSPSLSRLDFSSSPAIAYMGCLRADGRERLLEHFTDNNVDNAYYVDSAVLAAPYAGLALDFVDEHYGGQSTTLQVFDLRTGRLQGKLGGENNYSGLDQIVLGSDGVSAAHVQMVDPPGSDSKALDQVSCAPGTTTCVAQDGFFGHLFSATDPAGGTQAWTVTTLANFPTPGPLAIDCPSSTLCIAPSAAKIFISTNPAGVASTWTSTALAAPSFPNAITCPSQNLCVVARLDGSIAASTNPTGGAGAWTVSTSTPPFGSGSCPTTTVCVTVDGLQIQTTANPAAGPWTSKRSRTISMASRAHRFRSVWQSDKPERSTSPPTPHPVRGRAPRSTAPRRHLVASSRSRHRTLPACTRWTQACFRATARS